MMPFFLTVQSSNLLIERARRGRCTRIREVDHIQHSTSMPGIGLARRDGCLPDFEGRAGRLVERTRCFDGMHKHNFFSELYPKGFSRSSIWPAGVAFWAAVQPPWGARKTMRSMKARMTNFVNFSAEKRQPATIGVEYSCGQWYPSPAGFRLIGANAAPGRATPSRCEDTP